MMPRTLLAIALALAACSTAAGLFAAADSTYAKDVAQWRAKHEADYTRDWVSVAGLFFLKPGGNRAGSTSSNAIVLSPGMPASIGSFVLDGKGVRFEPPPGVAVTLRGQPVSKPIDLKDDSNEQADELVVNGVRLVVHPSGERRAIRVRDDHGEVARSFKGFRWFPIDEHYRVPARFIKDPLPHEVRVPNVLGDEEVYTTEGVVEFTLNGQKVRMRPMTTRPGRLYFIFRDGTSGKETYHTARFLYSDLRNDGTTMLDFNEAYNPPCAFNPYTTCPLPPPENRLKVRILAGEKDYPHEASKRPTP